jgi:hypothetical protein
MATLFNDKIFAQEIFQQLTPLLTPFDIFAKNVSPSSAQKGDAVIVPLFGNTTTTTFTQSTTVYEQTGGSTSAVTVNMNLDDITPVDLTARQLAESGHASNFDAFASQMASSHAERMLSHLFSAITTGSFGTAVTTAIANYDRDVLPLIKQAHVQAGVRGEKALVINTDVESQFLSDNNLTLNLNRGNANTMTEGDLGRLYGYDTYCSAMSLVTTAFRWLVSLLAKTPWPLPSAKSVKKSLMRITPPRRFSWTTKAVSLLSTLATGAAPKANGSSTFAPSWALLTPLLTS